MGERGAIGQMRRQENIYKQLWELDQEAPKVLQASGATAPTQQDMDNIYGAGMVNLQKMKDEGVTAFADAVKPFDVKTYEVTNKIEACGTMMSTCCISGCTEQTVELKENSMVMREKNNIDDEEIFLPYAEMDSVDVERKCFCCFEVNGLNPGFGCCNGALVKELADELQARKVQRGNIAQIKQLESMVTTVSQINCTMDLMLKSESIAYPPSAEKLKEVYSNGVPVWVSKLEHGPLHTDAARFGTTEYNVTNWGEAICACTCRSLILEPEELVENAWSPCHTMSSRTAYANVDSLDVEKVCFCCAELPDLAVPGCGCSTELVEEIAKELTERSLKRGDPAQLKMQENVTYELLKLDLKTDLLMNSRQITFPPGQEVMNQVFGSEGAEQVKSDLEGKPYVPSVAEPQTVGKTWFG